MPVFVSLRRHVGGHVKEDLSGGSGKIGCCLTILSVLGETTEEAPVFGQLHWPAEACHKRLPLKATLLVGQDLAFVLLPWGYVDHRKFMRLTSE